MSITEFWSMTLHEIGLSIRGYGKRVRAYQRMLAWQSSIIIRPHIKRPMNPRRLMPPRHEDD